MGWKLVENGQEMGGQWAGNEGEMGGKWVGDGREMGGKWAGNGWEMGGNWVGSGGEMSEKWGGNGWETGGKWVGIARTLGEGEGGQRAVPFQVRALPALHDGQQGPFLVPQRPKRVSVQGPPAPAVPQLPHALPQAGSAAKCRCPLWAVPSYVVRQVPALLPHRAYV